MPPEHLQTGVFITDRENVIILTVKRLIDMLKLQNVLVPTSLIYREKCGYDGAGSMSIYKSANTPMETANIFSVMYVPLSLKSDSGELIWNNQTPNSSHCCRPLALIAEKESKKLLEFINRVFGKDEEFYQKKGVSFEHENVNYKVKVIIENSMKDLKVRTMESGLGGADCLLCTSRRSDWKDLKKLEDFDCFAIDRTAAKTLDLYKQLLKDDGEIEKSKDDYNTRQGLTSKPLSSSDQHFITITHQYINGVTWILKIMYHLRSSLLNWSERGVIKEQINKARELVLNEIEKATGLRLDKCELTGNSGTSTTGGQGRRFFSFELRKAIVKTVPFNYQKSFEKLLHLYSVILRVVSSTESVDVPKFRQLTVDFAVLIAKEFPWIDYSMTTHSLIFHSAELIFRNNSRGLGEISEEALESTNKDVRNFREFLSRKCGHLENLTDVFNRLFLRSDPVVNHTVHESWSRRKRKNNKTVSTCLNEDDALFQSLLIAD
jgi:hypothetical protein